MSSSVPRAARNGRRLERSLSLRDLHMLNDGYSSQSSVVTDEEPRYSRQDKFGTDKTIHTVYAQKKKEHPTDDGSSGLYEAMRKEIRHAVEEIRTELEQLLIRKAAALKDLVGTRKRSNDRTRMSSKLVEEAEKYFVDFISNVEDTDISSFDGERSDGSSTLGCTSRASGGTNYTEAENIQSPAVPLGTDGVILPWLQWESSNDASPLRKSIAQTHATPTTLKFDAEELAAETFFLISSVATQQLQKRAEIIISREMQFDMDSIFNCKEEISFETYKAATKLLRRTSALML
ncbi:hypothetical protein Leryth_013836 [Lithospermum erythrorhizon]|nr:hypothetical protein Leryth_013836 [Lithospermum erythrorhizon]